MLIHLQQFILRFTEAIQYYPAVFVLRNSQLTIPSPRPSDVRRALAESFWLLSHLNIWVEPSSMLHMLTWAQVFICAHVETISFSSFFIKALFRTFSQQCIPLWHELYLVAKGSVFATSAVKVKEGSWSVFSNRRSTSVNAS